MKSDQRIKGWENFSVSVTPGTLVHTNTKVWATQQIEQGSMSWVEENFLIERATSYIIVAVAVDDNWCLCLFSNPCRLGYFTKGWIQDDIENPVSNRTKME